VQAIIFLGLAALFVVIERRTTLGRYVWAIGANSTASRIVGLPVDRVKLVTYIISGAGAGFAGYLSAIQVEAAASYYGQNAELSVITAILIGGTSMYGGEGSVVRSVLGAIVVGEVSDGLGVMNVNQNWQVIAMGALLVVAVTLSLTWRKAGASGGGRVAPRDLLLTLRDGLSHLLVAGGREGK
jgi:ribose transport system permease protein